MPDTIHLSSESVAYSFSSHRPPALVIDSGACIAIETIDAYDGFFRASDDLAQYRSRIARAPTNPVTGPVYVRDVEPGDGLDVTIMAIDLADTGFVAAIPGIGVLGDEGIQPRVCRFKVRPDGLWFEGRIRLPLRPMLGVIGVAPAAGEVPAADLGYHGGNLDCNDITVGTTVHLPVNVPGGLLSIGDAHAAMGFGEVYSGVNIEATVTLTVGRVPGAGWTRPWFETAAEVMTLGVEQTAEAAIRQATAAMTELLQCRLGVSFTEAVALTGAACDIRLGQASSFGVKVSAYAAFPKSALMGKGDRQCAMT